MIWKLFNVFWDDEVHTVGDAILVPDFKDLHVIAQNVGSHLVWRYVDYFYIGVLCCKDPA